MKPQPWPVGRPFPAAMTDQQLMSVLQMSKATFYRYKRAKALDRFALPKPVGSATWSGKKVDAYINEAPEQHEFTTKAFGAGRRLAAAS